MISCDDIESFLIRSELEHAEIGEGMWLVRPADGGSGTDGEVAVSYSPPLLVFRSRVRAAPQEVAPRLRLFERLLELNATDLVHGAYGLENDEIILTDALELEDLDYSEFLASLESLTLAESSHRQELNTD